MLDITYPFPGKTKRTRRNKRNGCRFVPAKNDHTELQSTFHVTERSQTGKKLLPGSLPRTASQLSPAVA